MKNVYKTAITVLVTAAVTFSATATAFTIRSHNSFGSMTNTSDVKRRLDVINTYLEENYLYDDIDYEKANDAAVKAYVDSLEEPYTHYYTKSEFEKYISNISESYTGIGVVITADDENGKIMILSPFVDSPAYDAGIKPGDYIISVDGVEYDSTQMTECVNYITGGKAGTRIKLGIKRDGEVTEIEVERGEITEESVSGKMLDGNIGYVAITAFNTNTEGYEDSTYTEFVECVEGLLDEGMEKMIIDLRDNPGGVMEVVCDIADYLLPEGIITYTETKTGKRKEYKSDENEIDIPIAVLINGNSASASEILTGALKDYGRAVVVGEKSYGKGIVQTTVPFTDGAGMSLTIAKYYTPSGVCIHGIGIEPDVEVKLPEEYADTFAAYLPQESDTQLQKAIELLKKD